MASQNIIDIMTNVGQGFNFSKDKQDPVAFVTALKINGADVAADISVATPDDPDKDMKVVGVCSSVFWTTEVTGEIRFVANVSTKSKNTFKELLLNTLKDSSIELAFEVYEYDTTASPQKYFKSFHTNDASVKASIKKNGGNLDIHIADEAGYEVQQPQNFALTLGVVPEPMAQDLHMAVSDTAKFVKQWGIATD
ncbi:MAG: hypothetical protein MK132_07405 [Lentisphaerales bacterium]|nr:hypothetical protein [Lentisphaerales bacterium]